MSMREISADSSYRPTSTMSLVCLWTWSRRRSNHCAALYGPARTTMAMCSPILLPRVSDRSVL
jgi:hypothetical protein